MILTALKKDLILIRRSLPMVLLQYCLTLVITALLPSVTVFFPSLGYLLCCSITTGLIFNLLFEADSKYHIHTLLFSTPMTPSSVLYSRYLTGYGTWISATILYILPGFFPSVRRFLPPLGLHMLAGGLLLTTILCALLIPLHTLLEESKASLLGLAILLPAYLLVFLLCEAAGHFIPHLYYPVFILLLIPAAALAIRLSGRFTLQRLKEKEY
ncbi:ABC-2 transporter permease [Diplocloster hominis]|uniref:ABC-2 transporter permease n=1 Tax=Diplocloster hominis TaxID=3079010 RepID=UPI0031BAD1C1